MIPLALCGGIILAGIAMILSNQIGNDYTKINRKKFI